MSVYAVTYDLHKPTKDYEKLIEQLKLIQPCIHPFESFWIIDSNKKTNEIRDQLENYIDNNDSILVIRMYKNWSSFNLSQNNVDWLKSDNRTFD